MIDNTDDTQQIYAPDSVSSPSDVLTALRPTYVTEPKPVATNGDTSPDRAVEMSRMLTGIVQDLVDQIESQEVQRRQLEERIADLEGQTSNLAGMRDKLRQTVAESLTADDLQSMQRALQALSRDPNHIMVLASIAQQADKLLVVVDSYARIQDMVS